MSGTQTAGQMIERLLRLAPQDRDWILAHLSAAARTNLLRQLGEASTQAAAESPPALESEQALDALDGDAVASYLASEPSWLVAMIMSLRSWRWENQLLARLPPVTRLEVNQMRGSLPPLSVAMKKLLAQTLRDQLPAAGQHAAMRFDRLLDRASERSL